MLCNFSHTVCYFFFWFSHFIVIYLQSINRMAFVMDMVGFK